MAIKKKKIPTMSIPLGDSRGPYVLGIDVGSTASRAGLYDASGCPVKGSKQRVSHEFTTGMDGTSAIDPDQVVDECREVITGVVEFANSHELKINAVAMDTFASSTILVDAAGQALTRCLTYADSRCGDYVHQLRKQCDEKDYHARTGVRFHTSYQPARLAWLQAEHPDLLEQTDKVMTMGEYVYFKLAGIAGQATSSAAWSGIINMHTGELDHEIFDALGLSTDLFQQPFDPDQPGWPADSEWPELNGVPWFHSIPDGWPSNVGPGAIDETTVAVAAATSGAMRVILSTIPDSVPDGLWCYRVSSTSCIVGGALNDVGRAVAWMERVLGPVEHEDLAQHLLEAPTHDDPVVLPFFSGERATGWAANARASITGITDDTSALDMWRGIFGGIAVSYERIYDQLDEAGASAERIIASGRVTTDLTEWLQVLADNLEMDVIPLAMKRATLRGTALIALDVIDPGGERAVPPFGEPYHAHEDRAEHYRAMRKEFDKLYDDLVADSN